MKLYLVFRHGDGQVGEATYLFGVFTTREAAEAEAERQSKEWWSVGIVEADADVPTKETI